MNEDIKQDQEQKEEKSQNWQIHLMWIGSILLLISMIVFEYYKKH